MDAPTTTTKSFTFSIPTIDGGSSLPVTLDAGTSVIFVGANGGGKTRLAGYIEQQLGGDAHRIAAHRALSLNPSVAKIAERDALAGLRYGHSGANSHVSHREGNRWQSKAAVSLLNDFDFLVQALFADQNNRAVEALQQTRRGSTATPDLTKLEQLQAIWERLLPDRRLKISGDDIHVIIPDSTDAPYSAAELSDGERAIFYMLGQVLEARQDSVLIFDEPELHIHRSILSKLWDELEAARKDCAFVLITHDLEFAASRPAHKFVIRDYNRAPRWKIESVPHDAGFDEQTATLILGSRRPILFVEGTDSSLDLTIYRCCFPEWTVLTRGSCEEVIHSVVTMRRNQQFTRVKCAGIVDADDYGADDVARLAQSGVAVLPVSEIENLLLLPSISREIAAGEGFQGAELQTTLDALRQAIFANVRSGNVIESAVARYCRRRIDRALKRIDLSSASTVADIAAEYSRLTSALDIASIAQQARDRINQAIATNNLESLLASYDNKGLLALAASRLKKSRLNDFEDWLTRILRNNKAPRIQEALRAQLPQLVAS